MTLGTPDTAAIGTWVKIASPVSVEIIAGAGFDFVVLDLEHGVVPLPWVHEACAIAQARGLAVLVGCPTPAGRRSPVYSIWAPTASWCPNCAAPNRRSGP